MSEIMCDYGEMNLEGGDVAPNFHPVLSSFPELDLPCCRLALKCENAAVLSGLGT